MTGAAYNPRDPREQWVEIAGYKYRYRVSNKGRVQKMRADGTWKDMTPSNYGGSAWRIQLTLPDGTRSRVAVSALVADAFLGGTPPGMRRCHKNCAYSDNSVENIVFLTNAEAAKRYRPGNSRPVVKLDREGNVVAVYRSQTEAARSNYITQQAISNRCNGKIEDPYRLDGYDYRFEG